MKYINKVTKNTIETNSKISGKNWLPAEEPKKKNVKEKKSE